jgi:hypothetical protein
MSGVIGDIARVCAASWCKGGDVLSALEANVYTGVAGVLGGINSKLTCNLCYRAFIEVKDYNDNNENLMVDSADWLDWKYASRDDIESDPYWVEIRGVKPLLSDPAKASDNYYINGAGYETAEMAVAAATAAVVVLWNGAPASALDPFAIGGLDGDAIAKANSIVENCIATAEAITEAVYRDWIGAETTN